MGWDGSVSLATRYGLDGSGIKSRWARYTADVQTGPVTHAASCTMGTLYILGYCSRDVALTAQTHLTPKLRKE